MRRHRLIALILTIAVTLPAASAPAGELHDGLGVLEPWLGTWQIEAAWASGTALWAQAEYRPILGGRFLEGRVLVRDGDGEPYQRYRTLIGWDEAEGRIAAYSFHHDGSISQPRLAVDGRTVDSSWHFGTTLIDERVTLDATGATMSWQVWATPADGERSQVMDGTWHRVEAAEPEPDGASTLEGPLAALAPFLGGWEIAHRWQDGAPLWARSEYRSGLGGRFVEATTWALNAEGAPYQRYETMFANEGRGLTMRSFAADGTVTEATVRAAEDGAEQALEIVTVPEARLRQRIEPLGEDAFRWQVWTRSEADGPWSEVIDGRWLRQQVPADGPPPPIRAERFADRGAMVRSFTIEREIAAPVGKVYAAWTTADGWSRVYPPPARARIELAVGGAYEWTFNGWLGSNGCQVLSYVPGRIVSFSWNAPPSQPANRLLRTWVVVETTPVADDRTAVRLTHLGFGEGAAWDETFTYFQSAWNSVLGRMAEALARP